MSNKAKIVISSLIAFLPSLAMAAGLDTIQTSATTLSTLITGTLPKLFFGLAIVYFFYGLASYVTGVDDKKKIEAKTTMIYGILIIFVMTSIFGIVSALQTATGVTGGGGTVPVIN